MGLVVPYISVHTSMLGTDPPPTSTRVEGRSASVFLITAGWNPIPYHGFTIVFLYLVDVYGILPILWVYLWLISRSLMKFEWGSSPLKLVNNQYLILVNGDNFYNQSESTVIDIVIDIENIICIYPGPRMQSSEMKV